MTPSTASGVMFSIDTESGFEDVVFITSSYGLGETVVQGAVNPDEFYVYKKTLDNAERSILQKTRGSKMIKMIYASDESPEKAIQTVDVDEAERALFSINDTEITELAKIAVTIEKHYGRPMDIEWAKDGEDGKLYIVQARPETVQSRSGQIIERYQLKQQSDVLVSGRAVGNRIGQGQAKVINDLSQMDQIESGDVLVTDHEKGRCDCHQSRWAHLPCRHYCARTGYSRTGGYRQLYRGHSAPKRCHGNLCRG